MAVLSPAEQVASREGRLAAEVELPDGRTKRWGPDEASTADVLAGLSFSTSDPGGFKDSNFGLSRSIDIEWPDLNLLLPVNIYGAGGARAWEGRLQERPGRHGPEDQITPGAVGWQAHLADRPFQEIYIDRDVTHWEDMSVSFKLAYVTGWDVSDGLETLPDVANSGPGIMKSAGGPITKKFWPMVYYGNGVAIGTWYQNLERIALGTHTTDPNVTIQAYSGDSDAGPTSTLLNADISAGGIQGFNVPGSKYVCLYPFYSGTGGGAAGVTYGVVARNPTIFGTHTVPIRGSFPSSYGLYASDVVADIVGRFAPKLNFSVGAEGSIQPTNYLVPQLAFTDPIKAADAISAVNAYHQYSWGVEDERRFFFRPTSTYRKRWRIRRSRGDGVELLGAQADAAVNGVVVSFTDPGGVRRIVGPPELTTAYTTSEALRDQRPTNPVNLVGGGQKWGELSLGFVTDVPGAIQIGAMWLANQLEVANARGSVSVTGVVEDEHGAFWPSWAMRAGDSATVVDGDNVERRIIETTYNADSRLINCNLDATPHRLEAIMERMGIAVAGL